MRMKDPIPGFSFLVNELKMHHPNLEYIHVVTSSEPAAIPPHDKSVGFGP